MAETMKALAKLRSEPGLTLIDAPVPEPGPRDVLIKVEASSICGTDVHVYNWDTWSQSRIEPPVILGHEFSGRIVEVGRDVDEWEIGEFVSAEGHILDWSTRGRPYPNNQFHLDTSVEVLGIDRDGAFAEYVVVPAENVWRNPSDLAPEIASLQDPFGNAVHTAYAFDLAGKVVLITGVGPIGLMTIPVARVAGATLIIVSDVSEPRLKLAEQMGADVLLNPTRDDVAENTRLLTEQGADVLLEMSGAAPAINSGLAALRPGGEAALLGVPARPIEVDWANDIVFKGITIKAIYGRKIWETWHRMRALLTTGAVDLSPLITHELPLEDFEEGFRLMKSRDEIVGKVILRP